MEQRTLTGRVIATRRAGSHQGNPTYAVDIKVGDHVVTALTQDRAQIGFAITNPEYRDEEHEFALTPHGRIQYARKVKA